LKSQDGLELCLRIITIKTPLAACKKGTVLAIITDPLENLNENKVAK
jgi:hypothetical protein